MKIQNIDLKKIDQNENSRVVYKESDLTELMHSMKKDGLLQPVGVKEVKGGRYECVFGNRRVMAARKLGWADIPAHVLTEAESENDRDILNLVENLKRQNTSVREDGRIFQALVDRGLSPSEIAARLGIRTERVEFGLEVFNEVPKEFAKKIVNRVTGSSLHKKNGQIPATAAHSILTLRKTHGLNRAQTRQLLNYAAKDGASVTHIQHVAPLLKEGFTVGEAIKAASKMSRVVMYVFIEEERIAKLEKKHGKSISSLLWEQLEKNSELGVRRLAGPKLSGRSRHREEATA